MFDLGEKVMNATRSLAVSEPDWQPTLSGKLVRLRPMTENDFDSLYAVASDPLICEQHPDRDRNTIERFRHFFRSGMKSKGALAISDHVTGQVIGSSRFTSYDPAKSKVEVGYTFLARSHWGGRTNRELKTLMLDHAFQFVDAVCFFVGESNTRSQRAMGKLGAVEVDRVTTVQPEGNTRASVVYEIPKTDWSQLLMQRG